MSSSRECLELERLEHSLHGNNLYLLLACISSWNNSYFEVLNRLRNVVAAAINPEFIGSKLHVASAAIEAYMLLKEGQSISKTPGINILLFLAASRSIRDVIGKISAVEGREAVIVAVTEDEAGLGKLEAQAREWGIGRCCFSPVDACKKLLGELPACENNVKAVRALVSRTVLFRATGV